MVVVPMKNAIQKIAAYTLMYRTTLYVDTKSAVKVMEVMYTAPATALVSFRPLTLTRRVANAKNRDRIFT